MGFFNFIFKGMGFKDENETKKEKRVSSSVMPEQPKQEKYSRFDNGLAKSFSVSNINENSAINSIPTFQAGGGNLVIYAPKENKDIKIIVECLRKKEPCIVDLGKLQTSDAEKILDFLSGAVYALDGNMQKVANGILLLVPYTMGIMGDFSDEIKTHALFDFI